MRKKSKKPVWGVCSCQDWSQKNLFAKIINSYIRDIFNKDPDKAKKALKSENIFRRFFQRGHWPNIEISEGLSLSIVSIVLQDLEVQHIHVMANGEINLPTLPLILAASKYFR